jgi:DNA helicase-2/ATP-dependent DNA helicase PcrA
VALEEKLLPHERSTEAPDKLEEERRLLFVGITRAEEVLQLSYAKRRSIRGGSWPAIPSSFLFELPRDEMDCSHPAALHLPESTYQGVAEWSDAMEGVDHPMDGVDYRDDAAPQPPRREQAPTVASLMTAAEMLGDPAGDRTEKKVDPDLYCQGMIINHPEYGLGKIVALSGTGARRRATVQFFNSSEIGKFVLAHSNLQPVKSTNR